MDGSIFEWACTSQYVCVCICVHENTRTDAFGLKSMEIICIQPILLLLLVLLDWILQIIFAQRVAGGWGGDMNINDNSQWIFPMKIFSKHAIFVFFSLNSPSLATSWAIFSLSIRNNLSLFCIVVTVSLDFFFLSFCTYFVLEKKTVLPPFTQNTIFQWYRLAISVMWLLYIVHVTHCMY